MTYGLEGRCSIHLSYGQYGKGIWRYNEMSVQNEKRVVNDNPFLFTGRSTRIRTLDPLVPNQVRYRAAPHSEEQNYNRKLRCRHGFCCIRKQIIELVPQFFRPALAPASHRGLQPSPESAVRCRKRGSIRDHCLPVLPRPALSHR